MDCAENSIDRVPASAACAANDVDLFDLQADPSETVNLTAERGKNSDLITTMSGKLEALIKAEIGDDNGREMPEVVKITGPSIVPISNWDDS